MIQLNELEHESTRERVDGRESMCHLGVMDTWIESWIKCNLLVFHLTYYREKFVWIGVPQQIDSTAEINPFPYARETKYLTLNDLKKYLILDG